MIGGGGRNDGSNGRVKQKELTSLLRQERIQIRVRETEFQLDILPLERIQLGVIPLDSMTGLVAFEWDGTRQHIDRGRLCRGV